MRSIFILAAILAISISANSQDITGQWNGTLEIRGVKVRLVFNIDKTDQGYRSTMDSPDQGAKGIPVSSTSFENPQLKLIISSAGIEYTGELDAEGKIIGTFKQGGASFSLNLTRNKFIAPLRPQEPQKPYLYYSEEVKFPNIKAKINLAGTLTLPNKEGKFPVVVLISGSGPQNRDEELLGHKPFLVLADHLTKNGIGVLRFDDRGVGASEGQFGTATSADFATDVEAAVAYLKTRKEVNKRKIGLIGHSEGGIIAPMVAAKSKDISFIVLLAGPGISGDKLLLLQSEAIGKASGLTQLQLENARKINQGAYEIVKNAKTTQEIETELTSYLQKNQMPKSEASASAKQMSSPWYQFFVKYDPSTALKNVKCPVLALNGEKDLQVPAKVNLQAIKETLEKSGNKKIVTKELANLNHLFQECKTCLISEYATLEQTFSPEALSEISSWILKRTK